MSKKKLPWLADPNDPHAATPPAPAAAPATPVAGVPMAGMPVAGMPVAGQPYPAAQPTAYPSGYPAAYPSNYPAGYPAGYPTNYPAAAPQPAAPYPGSYPAGYGGQPPYGSQPGYGAQPAYGAQPGYGAPAGYTPPPSAAPYAAAQPIPTPAYGAPGYPSAVPSYPAAPYPTPTYPPAAPNPYGTAAPPVPVVPTPAAAPVVPAPVVPVRVAPAPVAPAPVSPVTVAPVPVAPVPASPAATAVAPAPARPTPVAPTPVRVAPAQAAVAAPAVAPSPATAARPQPVRVATAGSLPTVVMPAAAPVVHVKEEEELTVEERLIDSAPPVLISAIIHALLIVILAILGFVISQPQTNFLVVEPIYAEELGVQLQDDTLTNGLMQNIEVAEPTLSKDELKADDPFAAPPEVEVTLDGTTQTTSIEAPSIGMALTGREKGAKEALLGKYGGTATTEAAVRAGLEWLKRNQEPSGTWSLTGRYSGGSTIENRCSATAMALLAFQGAGHTHKEGDFKKEVAKGWAALLKMQDRDGLFYHEGVHNQMLYSQAQATIAVCELYGMTKDKEFKEPAERAVKYAVNAQSPEGGWRYIPRQDNDTSVTGWYVMALQSAMMAGLDVPSPTLESINRFLDSVAADDGSRYGYRSSNDTSETMTAEGLLCRQYLGWKQDDPRLKRGTEILLSNPIRWDFDNTNVYYWYYATQVTHHMEGDAWKKWNAVMRTEIPKAQTKTGAEGGSWPPDTDRWGHIGGRLYTTCLSIYMLEVYYRHLPIYKWRQGR